MAMNAKSFFIAARYNVNISGNGFDGRAEPFKSQCQHGARTADIKTHETAAFPAEHGSVIEGKPGLVHEEVHQAVMGQAESAAIQPDQE